MAHICNNNNKKQKNSEDMYSSLTIGNCITSRDNPWKRPRSMHIQRGCDTLKQWPKHMGFDTSKKINEQNASSFIHKFDSTVKPLIKHKGSYKKHIFSSATPEQDNATIVEGDCSISIQDTVLKEIKVLYRFCRVYALWGTAGAVLSIAVLPLETVSDISPMFIVGLLKALISIVLMSFYVIGINQLCDVEVDKINKPFLPLASGDMSMKTGTIIVCIAWAVSIAMGLMIRSPPLLCPILAFFFLGSAYSLDLPFLRWKNNGLLAPISLILIRGISLPIGLFVHIQKYVLGRPVAFTKSLIFGSSFISLLILVISLLKDVPDYDGDKAFGSKNFTVLLGREKVFWLGTILLMMAYGVAVVVGASSSFLLSKLVTVFGHGILAYILWIRAKAVTISDPRSTLDFYLFIWKLLYAEYFLIPFVR